MSAGMMAAAVRRRNLFPVSIARRTARATTSMSLRSQALTTQKLPPAKPASFSATLSGPPRRMSSREMEPTASRATGAAHLFADVIPQVRRGKAE
jgi:hypothetical protein